MKFTFLTENKTQKEGVFGEHGLSILIETHGIRILFDAGASDLLIRNAEKIGADLATVDLAAVSHGHYDHTGGFPAFHRMAPAAPIYIHKDAFREYHPFRNGKAGAGITGIRWSEQEKQVLQKVIRLTDGPEWINDDIVISGTVPDIPGMLRFGTYCYEDNGETVIDPMTHEQFIAVREAEGVFLFSGCSHKGVAPILKYCRELFPGDEIRAFVSGLHLYRSGYDIRKRVIGEIMKEDIGEVFPVHCTGITAMCELKNAIGDKCVIPTAGETYER